MSRKKSYSDKDGSGRYQGTSENPEIACGFPGCKKVASARSLIDLHHIKPICMGGSDLAYNRMWVCPDHHRRIFVPDCPSGHHSIKHLDSIIVIGYLNSSVGRVLHFVDPSGVERYWAYRNGDFLWK